MKLEQVLKLIMAELEIKKFEGRLWVMKEDSKMQLGKL
jgi:hypothetical protein